MKELVLRGIVRPLVERLGTIFAAVMISGGIGDDSAAQIANGLVAAVAVLIDLVTAAVNRQRDETRLLAAISSPLAREDD